MGTSIEIYNFICEGLSKAGLNVDKQDICSYSPLTLAYIGDGVYELVIRSMILADGNAPVNKLHKKSSGLVKAETQAQIVKIFLDDELRIYKRGRNAQSYTKAKNASMVDYRMATGFEALIGYLYLLGKSDRMMELIGHGLKKMPL